MDKDRNDRGNDRGNYGDRPMYDALCSECKKECQVPFKPADGRPVYCRDCYSKRKRY
ncbi:MAG: CxxC-x17-CxxC domain-containing protein [Candidatus Micrarchaeota archaeon]